MSNPLTPPIVARDWKGNDQLYYKPVGATCAWTDGEAITLWQLSRTVFVVVYGLEVHPPCRYAGAARQLGEAIMHKAATDGTLRNTP